MAYVDLDPLSAFTTVPSTWLAQLLANTEALHDGSGFANDSIPAQAINFGGAGTGVWWEEIGRTTLGSAGDTITITGLASSKYLKIVYNGIPSGSLDVILRFNNDSGNNYAFLYADNFGSGTNLGNQSSIPLDGGAPTAYRVSAICELVNVAAQEKVGMVHAISNNLNGAGNTPALLEVAFKWANTSSAITRVDMINVGSGDFAVGSEVVVLGHN